jgi:hypothetical protein
MIAASSSAIGCFIELILAMFADFHFAVVAHENVFPRFCLFHISFLFMTSSVDAEKAAV